MVTDRDISLVDVLDRTGGLEVPSLQCVFGASRTVVYRRLARLEEYGMVAAVRPFRGLPALYIPTSRGLRELLDRDDLEPPSVSAGSYNHQVQVGRVIAQLDRRGIEWETSRITRRHQREARAAGDVAGAQRYTLSLSGADRSHLPDALIWPSSASRATQQPAAIEVELAQKTKRRLDDILAAYATQISMCGVVYVCGPNSHSPVLRAVERGAQEHMVNVTTLEAFDRGVSAADCSSDPTWSDRWLTGDPVSALELAFRSGASSEAPPLPGF